MEMIDGQGGGIKMDQSDASPLRQKSLDRPLYTSLSLNARMYECI